MKITSVTLFMPTIVAAASLTLASSAFTPANAYSVSPTNNAITFGTGDVGRTLDPMKWLVPKNSVGSNSRLAGDVTGEAVIRVNNFTLSNTPGEDFLTLTIKMLNTTLASLQSSIVSFGLGIDQNVSSVDIKNTAGDVFQHAIFDKNNSFQGGFKGIDICVAPSTKCSSQGINNGLGSGYSDTFELKIGGDFDPGTVTIASYPMRFQTEAGSFAVAGVPEPITMIGSGLALGFGALFKREASKKRSKDKVKS